MKIDYNNRDEKIDLDKLLSLKKTDINVYKYIEYFHTAKASKDFRDYCYMKYGNAKDEVYGVICERYAQKVFEQLKKEKGII